MTLADKVQDVRLLARGAEWLRRWVGDSKWKFFVVFCIVLVTPVATIYGYVTYLLYVTSAQTASYVQDLRYTSQTNSYHYAIDVIESCIDSTQDGEKLHTWYCNQAIAQYRDVSPKIAPKIARVNDVVKRKAFRAMRNDVAGYLRGEALQKEIQSRPTNTEKVLNVILSGTIEALLIIIIIAEGLGVFWFFRVYRYRRSTSGNA